jgi:hypothetical protein
MQMQGSEMNEILCDFPKFELSYEMMGHKKVLDADIMMAIPEGTKAYAWFTSYRNENVCFLLSLDEHNLIINAKICMASFKDELSYGTILYGTLFSFKHHKEKDITCNSFCVEDIIMYKGKMIYHHKFINRLETIIQVFQNKMICQPTVHQNQVIFGMPIMSHDFQHLLREIEGVPYKIGKIKFRYYESKKIVWLKYFKPGSNSSSNTNTNTNANIHDVIFKISADIQNDIYNLFVYDNENDGFYDVAFIPDYKTSVMMNGLFRNIKENINLDALEESDDEEEFESEKIDKYVDLNKTLKMNCRYNHKFKRWVPISLANSGDKIVTHKYLRNIMNSNYQTK